MICPPLEALGERPGASYKRTIFFPSLEKNPQLMWVDTNDDKENPPIEFIRTQLTLNLSDPVSASYNISIRNIEGPFYRDSIRYDLFFSVMP